MKAGGVVSDVDRRVCGWCAQTMQVSDIQVMFQEFEQVVVDLREQMLPST